MTDITEIEGRLNVGLPLYAGHLKVVLGLVSAVKSLTGELAAARNAGLEEAASIISGRAVNSRERAQQAMSAGEQEFAYLLNRNAAIREEDATAIRALKT